MVELALHDLLELELESLDSPHIGTSIGLLKTVDVEGALMDVGDIIILKVQDLLGVLNNGGGIRRQEELGRHGHAIISHESARLRPVEERLVGGGEASAKKGARVLLYGHVVGSSLGRKGSVLIGVLDVDEIDLHSPLSLDADDKGRSLASCDDLVGVVHRFDQQTVSTLKLLNDSLGKIGKANTLILVVEVLGKLGNALSIGFSLELKAFASEEGLELLVVGNDTIVDDAELPVRVRPLQQLVNSSSLIHPR